MVQMEQKIDWKWWKKQVIKDFVPQCVYMKAKARNSKIIRK